MAPKWNNLLRYTPVLIVVTVSLAVTVAFQITLYTHDREEETARLAVCREQLRDSFEERLNDYQAVLRGAKGLIDASENVTFDEWASYVKAIYLEKNSNGIMGVAFIRRVRRREMTEFLARERETRPTFTVWPQSDRDELYPILYNEPMSLNGPSIGFDVVTNKTALAALRHAMTRNSVSLTEPLVLVQDAQKRRGMVMYIPVYHVDMPISTPQERTAALAGWVSGPFRIVDFMDTVLSAFEGRVCVELFDGDQPEDVDRLFVNGGLPPESAYGDRKPESTTTQIAWGGQNFRLRLWTLPDFYESDGHSILTLILGLIFSLLAGVMTWSLVFTRQRATALAEGMTEAARDNEERFRSLVDNLPGAVYRCRPDDDRTLMYQSDMLREISAWPDNRNLNNMYMLVYPEDHADVRSVTRMARANKQEYHLHYRITQSSGLVRWVSDYGRPVLDDSGILVAFEGMIFDITDRKRMEQRWKCIFEQRRDLVGMLDGSGRIKMANAAFRDMLDYEPVDLVGKQFTALIHPRDGNDFLEELRRLTIGMVERSLEIRILGRDSNLHWISWTLVLDSENDQVYIYGREITHLKRESRGVRTRGATPEFGAMPVQAGPKPDDWTAAPAFAPSNTPTVESASASATPSGGSVQPPLDPYFLNPLKEMTADDGRPLLDMLIDLFKEDTPAQIENLGRMLQEKNFSEAKNIAHDLKGSTGNVGALPLAACFTDLDAALRDGQTAFVGELFSKIEAEAQRVYDALESERSTSPAAPATPATPSTT